MITVVLPLPGLCCAYPGHNRRAVSKNILKHSVHRSIIYHEVCTRVGGAAACVCLLRGGGRALVVRGGRGAGGTGAGLRQVHRMLHPYSAGVDSGWPVRRTGHADCCTRHALLHAGKLHAGSMQRGRLHVHKPAVSSRKSIATY